VCAQVTQTKTGLSAVRTFSPLGANVSLNKYKYLQVIDVPTLK
jgi:hypothetical protein